MTVLYREDLIFPDESIVIHFVIKLCSYLVTKVLPLSIWSILNISDMFQIAGRLHFRVNRQIYKDSLNKLK